MLARLALVSDQKAVAVMLNGTCPGETSGGASMGTISTPTCILNPVRRSFSTLL